MNRPYNSSIEYGNGHGPGDKEMIAAAYNVVDSNSGEVVGSYKEKFDAQMKAYELNNSENGYKYVVEVA